MCNDVPQQTVEGALENDSKETVANGRQLVAADLLEKRVQGLEVEWIHDIPHL